MSDTQDKSDALKSAMSDKHESVRLDDGDGDGDDDDDNDDDEEDEEAEKPEDWDEAVLEET